MDLTCEGWHVITIIREVLDRDADRFRQYLSKAVDLAQQREEAEYYALTEAGRKEAERLMREEDENR